jgi:hypothetical protein
MRVYNAIGIAAGLDVVGIVMIVWGASAPSLEPMRVLLASFIGGLCIGILAGFAALHLMGERRSSKYLTTRIG